MKTITITHPGGIGDGIMFSPIIKSKFAKEYDMVHVDVHNCKELFKDLYSDTPNVKYGNGGGKKIRLKVDTAVEHDSWRNLTWSRNEALENELHSRIVDKVGPDYILTHERKSDNVGRKMLPIQRSHFLNKDLPVVNLDRDWCAARGFPIKNILHYSKVLNSAKEIHFYEGSYMNFADAVVQDVPLFGHLYCKPHLFDESMVHNKVIKFIEAGTWHKNNWNYIWK